MLEVSRAGYYQWSKRGTPKREQQNTTLLRRSRELYARNKGRYESPRMSRKGDCRDNAPMEPFFKMMEVELIYPKK